MKNANPNLPGAERNAESRAGAPRKGTAKIPVVVTLAGGAIFMAFGLFVYVALLGLMPGKPLVFNVPTAVIWLIATVFFCAGIGIAVYRFLPGFAGACGFISLLAFIAVFNWIAFGPGERSFTRTSSMGSGNVTITKKSSTSEIEGRIVFGLVAGFFDVLLLFGLYKSIKGHPQRDRASNGAANPVPDDKDRP